jgi:hypothetical protein
MNRTVLSYIRTVRSNLPQPTSCHSAQASKLFGLKAFPPLPPDMPWPYSTDFCTTDRSYSMARAQLDHKWLKRQPKSRAASEWTCRLIIVHERQGREVCPPASGRPFRLEEGLCISIRAYFPNCTLTRQVSFFIHGNSR